MRETNGSFDSCSSCNQLYKFDVWNKQKLWLLVSHVNGWVPAVFMSYMSQDFRLFHASSISVQNFRFFLLMYPWSMTTDRPPYRLRRWEPFVGHDRSNFPVMSPTPGKIQLLCAQPQQLGGLEFDRTWLAGRVEWGSAPTLREIFSVLFISKVIAFIRFPP